IPDVDHWRARGFDRANAPPEIIEILRLSRSSIRSWLPQFQPKSEWAAHEAGTYGALCLSPHGRQIISSSMNGPFRFWDPDTRGVVNEVAKPQNIPVAGLLLSPDGSIAVIQGWGDLQLLNARTWRSIRELAEPFIDRKRRVLSHPQFTPDGRFLLLQ